MSIKSNFEAINNKVLNACERFGRKRDDVKIIAVTKTRSTAEINEAISLGITDIGENRVQELMGKIDFIDSKAKIHLIGQLQTNKVKYVLGKVDAIHSLDRISLAQQIEKLSERENLPPQRVLIEVNIGAETTKCGILPNNLTEYLDILANFRYINPIGLMTVAPSLATEDELNVYFAQMQELLQKGKNVFGENFNQLSMGMSRDYEIAIKHGATMIRLGTALFGERNYNI
ncbi:MAG: YggS family pyridoxal phosphate-dependent enzyme [Clostridia bacterium]|nr:YggS family pyridoxal phosphate-dependent enzyme [Clostridia bacterium]